MVLEIMNYKIGKSEMNYNEWAYERPKMNHHLFLTFIFGG